MNDEYKTIHAHVWDPSNSLFKEVRSHKAKCTTVSCKNSENCGLFARGECSLLGSFNWQKCPYGNIRSEEGFTKKAQGFRKWISDKKAQFEGVGSLKSHANILAIVGDYVFLPYSHMTMNTAVPFLAEGGFFRKENCFLRRESFTIENIISICNFRPQAMMGGEITSYQKEEVPKFIKHLSEHLPDIYKELCVHLPWVNDVVSSFSHIGRKALLSSTTPNAAPFSDIHGASWNWDGKYLTSVNSKASFMLVSKFDEIRIRPKDKAEVTISSDNQVNPETIFLS